MTRKHLLLACIALWATDGAGGIAAAQRAPATGVAAEQAAAGRGGEAIAPPQIVWPSPPLPDGPMVYETALVRPIRIVATRGLNQPWSMAFLPGGEILVTERPGRLRIIRNAVLDPQPVAGLPQMQAQGLGGLMDIALHPRFDENKFIYFTYNRPAADGADGVPPPAPRPGAAPPSLTLARGRWDGTKLVDVKAVFSAGSSAGGGRIIFGKDGMVYMSVGSGDPRLGNPNPSAEPAQDPARLGGKVLRLKDDGSVPGDNPFVGRAGYRPEIYTMGHRNILGLAVQPDNGAIWSVEMGPNGGDEINILAPGKNYGWPIVSNGRFYLGPRVSENPYREGMEPPLVYWVPAIAPSGLTFYTGDKFPKWKGHVFVGGMRQGELPRSGHLERVDFNDKWEELHRESLLRELQQRIRDVRQGPDGLLYVLTGEDEGALLKIEPGPFASRP